MLGPPRRVVLEARAVPPAEVGGGLVGGVEEQLEVAVGVTVDDQGVVLTAGEAKLSLRQTSSSDGTATLEVAGSSVVIEQGGDVTVKATGKLTLQATEIEIAGDASVKVAGQTIALN